MIRSMTAVAGTLAGAFGVAAAAGAGSVTIEPVQDNTLYEHEEGILTNGGGNGIFAGRTNQFSDSIRRGLIAFDVAGNVPAGAVITSASLRLVMNQTLVGAEPVSVHRTLADWGEGEAEASGGEGGGANPTGGDVTWVHTYYPKTFWANPGGDFVEGPSATTMVAGTGAYTWGPTDQMIADVQSWLDDPSGNYGWLLKGNEDVQPTAKRFASREIGNPKQRPMLTIEFELPACDADIDMTGSVDVDDLVAVILAWGPCPPDLPCPADIDGSTVVDVDDLVAVILAWGPCR